MSVPVTNYTHPEPHLHAIGLLPGFFNKKPPNRQVSQIWHKTANLNNSKNIPNSLDVFDNNKSMNLAISKNFHYHKPIFQTPAFRTLIHSLPYNNYNTGSPPHIGNILTIQKNEKYQ